MLCRNRCRVRVQPMRGLPGRALQVARLSWAIVVSDSVGGLFPEFVYRLAACLQCCSVISLQHVLLYIMRGVMLMECLLWCEVKQQA